MDWYDIFSLANIVLALTGFGLMLKLARKYTMSKTTYVLVSLFCLYEAGVYSWLLLAQPEISLTTAMVGRIGLTLVLTGIIMLGILEDR